MAGLQSSSGMEPLSLSGANQGDEARSTWVLALAGLLAAVCAATVLNVNPRWFAYGVGSVMLQSARMVLTTAAIGAAVVWVLWYVVSDRPSGGVAWLARNLSACWVFLPCVVLFDQARSVWTLLFAALVAMGFALSLRRLLPRIPEAVRMAPASDSPLPSLDGLPAADSPILLAVGIALLLQAAVALALGVSILLGSLPLAVAVFLLTWRWSAYEVRAAEWWGGRHPPLRQLIVAVAVTAMMLVPYTFGRGFGWGIGFTMPVVKTMPPKEARASSGYFGIILYPPPKKQQLLAPELHKDTFAEGGLVRPLVIPFDGPYLYFRWAGEPPGPKAHVAHGRPTDANINPRSTDLVPLVMEAHQRISRPISLEACGEIDVTVTNADTNEGEIDLGLVLSDASLPAHTRQVLAARPVLSSMADPIPKDRRPVSEVLRFAVPRGARLRRFDEITLKFMLAARRNRTGAKVSVESFELVPRQ